MTDLEKMKSLAAKGKVSRREFIQYALATGMTVAAADTLFVKAVQAAPKKGGFARIALAHGATTDSMDPGTYPDTGTQVPLSGTLSNSLMEVDNKGNVIFDLAESMEPSDDVKTWRFKLKKGLTFHNGKDVTANDVVAANVYLLGGAQQLTPATQGIETLLLASSERGTKRFPREKVRQLTAGLGSQISIGPSEDWTLFGFTSVRSTFDSTFGAEPAENIRKDSRCEDLR